MTLRMVGLGLAVMVAVPFAVTGMYRLLPYETPTAVPFLVLGAVGVPLLLRSGLKRAAGAGLLAGAALWAAALVWLFAQWGDLDRMG